MIYIYCIIVPSYVMESLFIHCLTNILSLPDQYDCQVQLPDSSGNPERYVPHPSLPPSHPPLVLYLLHVVLESNGVWIDFFKKFLFYFRALGHMIYPFQYCINIFVYLLSHRVLTVIGEQNNCVCVFQECLEKVRNVSTHHSFDTTYDSESHDRKCVGATLMPHWRSRYWYLNLSWVPSLVLVAQRLKIWEKLVSLLERSSNWSIVF